MLFKHLPSLSGKNNSDGKILSPKMYLYQTKLYNKNADTFSISS